MLFKLTATQEDDLLNQPETGMGYQIVEANRQGQYLRERFLILNSEIVIEINIASSDNVRGIIQEGIVAFKARASFINLSAMIVLNE